jgi:hypothetical protein
MIGVRDVKRVFPFLGRRSSPVVTAAVAKLNRASTREEGLHALAEQLMAPVWPLFDARGNRALVICEGGAGHPAIVLDDRGVRIFDALSNYTVDLDGDAWSEFHSWYVANKTIERAKALWDGYDNYGGFVTQDHSQFPPEKAFEALREEAERSDEPELATLADAVERERNEWLAEPSEDRRGRWPSRAWFLQFREAMQALVDRGWCYDSDSIYDNAGEAYASALRAIGITDLLDNVNAQAISEAYAKR